MTEESNHSELVQQMCMGLRAIDTDIDVNIPSGFHFSFGDFAALGAGFSSLSNTFRTITQTVELPVTGLLSATDAKGVPLDISKLQKFNDGSGLMGSTRDSLKGFSQARLHAVDTASMDIVTEIPFDPTQLCIAMALMEVNKKLDQLQETQQAMFDYIKQRDKAQLRGNLQTLIDVMDNYRFNWNNEQYKQNKHILVQDIRREAEQSIVHRRAQIKAKLGDKGFFHGAQDVSKQLDEVLEELKEYQLALYLYAFSSFLEIMLLGNFDEGYLESTTFKIDEYADKYRILYSRCFEAIENGVRSSVEAIATDALSAASKGLGEFLDGTPIGWFTPLNDALSDAGDQLSSLKDDNVRSLTSKLTEAKAIDVKPFVHSIENVNRLYNEPSTMILGSDGVYVLPIEGN